MSIRLRLLNIAYRLILKPVLRHAQDPLTLRAGFERNRPLFHTPKGFWEREAQFTRKDPMVSGRWVGAGAQESEAVILFVHGGGFVAGSSKSYAKFAATLAGRIGGRAAVPDYRLAPEHRFPAASDDVMTSYLALLDQGIKSENIILIGDSAGGNLVLGLLARICSEGLPKPAGLVAICPVADLTYSGDSIITNAKKDVVLPVERAQELNAFYLGSVPPGDPVASPLFADYPGCPPVLIQGGSTEILASDARRMADRLREFGAEVTYDIFPDCPHVWHLLVGYLPEAETAVSRIADFCKPLIANDAKPGGA